MNHINKKLLPSKLFGGWEMRMNGLEQLGLTPKKFLRLCRKTNVLTLKPVSKSVAQMLLNKKLQRQCWYSKNGKYKVVIEKITKGDGMCHDDFFEGTTWLSIRINNGDDYLCDWREFQQIKNDLCGEAYCGIEIYPPESSMVDTVNVFHLWVFPEGKDIPLGYMFRDVSFDQEPNQRQELT